MQGNRLTFDRQTFPDELGPLHENSMREEVQRQAEINFEYFCLKNLTGAEPSGILQGDISYQTLKPLPLTWKAIQEYPKVIQTALKIIECQKLIETRPL